MQSNKDNRLSSKKSRLVTAGVAASLSLVMLAGPSKAFSLNDIVSGVLTQLFSHAQQFIFGVDGIPFPDFFQEVLNEFRGNFTSQSAPETLEAVEEVTEETGTVDYQRVMARVNEMVLDAPAPDNYGLDASMVAQFEEREAVRTLTKGNIQSVLSMEAEENRASVIESVQSLTADVAASSDTAQNLSVTQDIMKELVSIQASQTGLMAEMRLEQLNQRIDTAHSNANLVNISKSLDEMNRAEQIRNGAGSAFTTMQTSVMAGNIGGGS